MIKVFISQPMRDKTQEEILAERKKAIDYVKGKFGDSEVIDSYFEDFEIAPETKNKPLAYLAKSISLLANADVAVFCKDWRLYRGCKIEFDCALDYGLSIVLLEEATEDA